MPSVKSPRIPRPEFVGDMTIPVNEHETRSRVAVPSSSDPAQLAINLNKDHLLFQARFLPALSAQSLSGTTRSMFCLAVLLRRSGSGKIMPNSSAVGPLKKVYLLWPHIRIR